MAIRVAASFASFSPPCSASPKHFRTRSASPKSYPVPSPGSIPQLKTTTTATTRSRSSIVHGFSGSPLPLEDDELVPSVVLNIKASEALEELKGTSIFLVGMNNRIKRNLGKLLATALTYYYFDSDELLEQALGGESAAKSLQESDLESYHETETEVLKQLSSMGRLVVCAGDGAVQNSSNLALLRYGISIWIDLPLEFLANKMAKNEDVSPLAATEAMSDSDSSSEILDKLRKQYDELKEGYGSADSTLSLQKLATQMNCENMDSVTLEDMAFEALRQIEKLVRTKKMMEAAARPF